MKLAEQLFPAILQPLDHCVVTLDLVEVFDHGRINDVLGRQPVLGEPFLCYL